MSAHRVSNRVTVVRRILFSLRRILFRPLSCAVLLAGLAGSPLTVAERLPVLKQIDLPHPYYFREMYLPQLTSGSSAAAWPPDSKSLIYSMGGSLWRQNLDSTETEELTWGPGYDYHPDY